MQQPTSTRPTVGDTTTIVYRVAAPPGAMVMARLPIDSTLVSLLGAPSVTREGDSVRIAYPVTLWAPGRNELVIPGPIVVRANVAPDTLRDLHIMLDVASVLPSQRGTDSIPPRPAVPWVPAAERSPIPFLVLLPLTLLVLALVHWWWRRLGPMPKPADLLDAPPLTRARVDAWLMAGEGPLVLRHLDAATRGDVTADEWRARAVALRYAPADELQVIALVEEGWDLLQRGRSG